MRDMTTGSIPRHLIGMAAFLGVGLVVQTLYFLVDLWFVSTLGPEAIGGVGTAGTSTFLIMAATQLVAVGALSLISQAIGRKDEADGQLVFDQALSMALFAAVLVLLLGFTLGSLGVKALAASPGEARQGQLYLAAFLPSLAMMFPMNAMGAALRASGVVGKPMVLQAGTVLANALLAPVLVTGWGTGHPFGVVGAGLASSIATILGAIVLAAIFNRMQPHLRLHLPSLKPQLAVWRRITNVGLPAAGEFALLFVITSVIFYAIRGFGPDAHAGFGIGQRVMQSIFLPAMAVAFAAAPIAGQNFGARLPDRVRATFRHAALIGSGIMLVETVICQISPELLIRPFAHGGNPAVVAIGAQYLRYTSWNFVAVGLVFACSGMFQAFGDTRPALLSSASRLLTFVLPAIVISHLQGVQLHDFWRLSVASVALQAVTSLLLLRWHMRRKLAFNDTAPLAAAAT